MQVVYVTPFIRMTKEKKVRIGFQFYAVLSSVQFCKNKDPYIFKIVSSL